MKNITDKQMAVLAFIDKFKKMFGYSPSSRDIQLKFGFKSQTAAMNHLQALDRRGYIERVANKARTITISSSGLQILLGKTV